MNVDSLSYQIKEASSFGLDITYAEFSVRFEGEIGITLPIVCPAFDCAEQDSIDLKCVCNYASKDPNICGIVDKGCTEQCNSEICNQ